MQCMLAVEKETIKQAKSLLYKNYVEHYKWEIEHENPSGIKILTQGNFKVLSDDYDDLSNWFVVMNDHDQVTACARLCSEDNNAFLEVERYPNAKFALQEILSKKHELNMIELNREAVAQENIGKKEIFYSLLKGVFEFSLKNGYTILSTTNISEWVSIYSEVGIKKIPNIHFKYSDADRLPVDVFLLSQQIIKDALSAINDFLLRNILLG